MRRLLLSISALLCALALAACGASTPHRSLAEVELLHGQAPQNSSAGRAPAYHPSGPLIADSGFRPGRNGFAFENYSTSPAIAELSATQVEELFGPEVCVTGTRATCRLIPPAQTWLERENAAMADGHCFGMSVASEDFFSGHAHVDLFGAHSAGRLKLNGNASLQQYIAQNSALQEIPAIRQRAITGTPNHILDTLIDSLGKPNHPPYTLGLFRPDGAGGHAVTPYAVEDHGDGRYAVLVYDSNHPRTPRAISFDRYADAWKFVAQSNPGEPKQVYRGHGEQGLMALYPTAFPDRPLPCPFCDGGHFSAHAKGSGGHYIEINEISLSGDPTNHARLLITDLKGRHTGYIGRRFVNQIPRVKVLRRLNNRDWLEDPEPIYLVPVGVTLRITVDGRFLKQPVTERLDLVGDGDDLTVGDIQLRRGEKVHVTFQGDGTGLSYTTDPRQAETALLQLGVEDSPASYEFSVKAHHLSGAATISARLAQPGRQLTIATGSGDSGGAYDLRFRRLSPQGVRTFERDDLHFDSRELIRLDYGAFGQRGSALPLRRMPR
jgi:hypothetical protein